MDKAAGAEREVVKGGGRSNIGTGAKSNGASMYGQVIVDPTNERTVKNDITLPATPLAAVWEGHRYGLQALKPALEPIIVFQKPYESKPVEDITRTGAGALNIDGGRIGTNGGTKAVNFSADNHGTMYGGGRGKPKNSIEDLPSGRWPANFVLTHSPECVRVGVQRVRGDKRPPGGTGGIWSDVSNKPVAGGKADPDGLETIDAWDCVDGGSYSTYQFFHNSAAVSPVDEPSFLLDRLRGVLQDSRDYNMTCNNLAHGVSELYHSGRRLSEVSDSDLAYAALNVLQLAALPGCRSCCPSCLRLCGGQLRQILTACQDGPPLLNDALDCVHQFLSELSHNPQSQCLCHQSSSDDSGLTGMQIGIGASRISDGCHIAVSPERVFRIEGMAQSERQPSEQLGRIPENNTCECDSREILAHNECKSAVVRLLSLACIDLAWRYLLPGSIIQRNEIVVNYGICPVKALGEQSGVRNGTATGGRATPKKCGPVYGEYAVRSTVNHNDTGTAARFFHQSDWSYEIEERLAHADPVRYQAKASRKERDQGLEDFVRLELEVCLCPENDENMERVTSLERAISEYVTELAHQSCSTDLSGNGRMVLCHQIIVSITSMETNKTTDSKTWSVLTSQPTKEFIAGAIRMLPASGLSLVANVENLSQSLNTMSGKAGSVRGARTVVSETPLKINASVESRRNWHPTLKPIALAQWLATLLLPPDEYAPRRLMVPFAGSGSEMIGAALAGWDEIVGIEMDAETCAIAEARLAHWLKEPRQLELAHA